MLFMISVIFIAWSIWSDLSLKVSEIQEEKAREK